MAACEKCGTHGYLPQAMSIENDIFVGPCCATPAATPVRMPAQVHVLPAQSDDVEYGVEVTNKKGVKAYVRYGGLDIAFERSPQQIRTWAEKNGLVDEKRKSG